MNPDDELAAVRRRAKLCDEVFPPTMCDRDRHFLLGEVDRLRKLNESLCERIAAQSELLSKKAEKVTYDPAFGDDRLCMCGHPYHRHFDSYEDMEPVGCKYCQCCVFKEFEKGA